MPVEVRDAVAAAELYADGAASKYKLRKGQQTISLLSPRRPYAVTRTHFAAYFATASTNPFELACRLVQHKHTRPRRVDLVPVAGLIREVFGDPLKPYPPPASWPSAIVKLAEAMYAGEDCSFALHDALLEAGHPELAEHFAKEQSHPKGCWVLDLVLGKK